MTIQGSWNYEKLENVAKIDPESLSNSTQPNYEFTYIDLSCVDKGKIQANLKRYTFAESPSRARRKIQKNDVLLSTVRPYLQGFAIIQNDIKDFVCSTGFSVIRTHNESDASFVYQCLFSHSVLTQINALLVGSNYPAINSSDVKRLQIPFPSFEERKKIAEILGTIDRTLELTQKLITAKRKLKQALMQKLLAGKLRFPEFEGQKSISYKLKDVCKVRQGLQIPISERYQEPAKNRYLYITVSYINSQEKNNFNHEYIDNPRKSVICNNDDILVARTGAVGQIVTNIQGVFHNNFFCVDYFKNKINKDFLYFFLNSNYIQYQLKSRAATTTIPDLKHSDFYSLDIYLPALQEQEKIASCLNNLDDEIGILEKQKQLLTNQKKGLMQKLLTGKIRVKIDN